MPSLPLQGPASPTVRMRCTVPPECHPERSRGRRATERSRSFAKWSIRRAAGYGIEQNRAAGSANGLPKVCLAPVIFSQQSQIDYVQMLLCASRRVVNRLEIPSSSCAKRTSSSVLDRLAAILPLPLQNFDCEKNNQDSSLRSRMTDCFLLRSG